MRINFKNFLIRESNNIEDIFYAKLGNIINSLHDLDKNKDQTSLRDLFDDSIVIVNEIRRILHSNWGRGYLKELKSLQKCGVAIMNAVEKKGDIKSTISSCLSEIQNLTGEHPINEL